MEYIPGVIFNVRLKLMPLLAVWSTMSAESGWLKPALDFSRLAFPNSNSLYEKAGARQTIQIRI